MLSAKRLQPIQQLSEQREDAAAEALAEARRQLAQRETQLRELENYREPAGSITSVELLLNREAFRLKLNEAIAQQRRAIELSRRLVEQQRQRWIASHQQTQVYDHLAERSREHERRCSEQRAQRDLDELALRGAASGSAL